jgi:hypothetical protein
MSTARSLADGLAPLRAWFEADTNRVRIIAIQSAT